MSARRRREGRAVVNLIQQEMWQEFKKQNGRVGWRLVDVIVSAGHEANHVGEGRWHVPKKHLVGVLQVLLQSRRLHVADSLKSSAARGRFLGGSGHAGQGVADLQG